MVQKHVPDGAAPPRLIGTAVLLSACFVLAQADKFTVRAIQGEGPELRTALEPI
jgi:hypothetical protein